ncbi:hypothetical protein ACIBJF_46250 [Streptomyces sp. NPDC050743]|uniref:hypothetical protein n=1 Tax=Streptomyces sp. NPDC050743 TaxID=3365634 RepID=UPI00378C18BE
MGRLRDLDPPTGEQLREVIRYEHDRVGDLLHVDVKLDGTDHVSHKGQGSTIRRSIIWRRQAHCRYSLALPRH